MCFIASPSMKSLPKNCPTCKQPNNRDRTLRPSKMRAKPHHQQFDAHVMRRMDRVEIGADDDPPVVEQVRNGVRLVVGLDEFLSEDVVLKPLLENETSDDWMKQTI